MLFFPSVLSTAGVLVFCVIGDSHSFFTFSGIDARLARNPGGVYESEYLNIHRFDGRTLHRMGRDGMDIPAIVDCEPRIVLLVLGEVDCRCHIKRQIDDGCNEAEVIGVLADNYKEAILANQAKMPTTTYFYIVSVLPAADDTLVTHNPAVPFVGSNEDRARYVVRLNERFQRIAVENRGIRYFDVWDIFATVNGTMNFNLSDGHVHVGRPDLVLPRWVQYFGPVS